MSQTCADNVMLIERFEIDGIFSLLPARHGDQRGFFSETYRRDKLADLGVPVEFVQDNHARSARRGVLRGLHFQKPPYAQGKLVRCTKGAILDIGVDIRSGSPTFGQHVCVELSAANWKQLWVPPGFAHGYVTLEDDCEVIYKVTEYYTPSSELGVAWDDPTLGIDWRIPLTEITLSEKDKNNSRLNEIESPFKYTSIAS